MEDESTVKDNKTEQSSPQKQEVQAWITEFNNATDAVVRAMKEIGRNSDKLMSRVFLFLGTSSFLLILRTSISRLSESPVWSYEQVEFISVVAISTFLILCGLSLRVCQYRTEREISRWLTDLCIRIFEKRADTTSDRHVAIQAPRILGSFKQEKEEGREKIEMTKENANSLSA